MVESTLESVTTKGLSPKRLEHAKAFVQAIVDRDFGKNVNAAAKAFGISQPQLADLLGDRGGAGIKLLEAVADYEHVMIDHVIGRSAPAGTGATDTIEARGRAVIAARVLGYTEEAIESVRAQAPPDRELTPREWLLQIEAAQMLPPVIVVKRTPEPAAPRLPAGPAAEAGKRDEATRRRLGRAAIAPAKKKPVSG